MNNIDKKNIILDRILQIDIQVEILNRSILEGYKNKEGQPSFEKLIEDFMFKKQVLENELNLLTNQG
jgi:hypothetical protein